MSVMDRQQIAISNFERLAADAHHAAYQMSPQQIADYLRRALGRPLVAHITNTSDVKTVTRWAQGQKPEQARLHKMRVAFELHYVLSNLFKSEESASDWFTGRTALRPEMPADLIRNDQFDRVFAAVRAVAQAVA